MRLLFVHADRLEFETVTEAGEGVAETEGVPMEGRMEDCVTAFVSVERGDEADIDAAVGNAVAEVRDVTDRLNTRRVVLYPDANLGEDLADPDTAKSVLQNLEAALADDREVLRAPFGWHTAFEVASKGHPLAELSRRVTPERGESADAERAPSDWRVAFPDGELRDVVAIKDADRVSDGLRALAAAETAGEARDTAGESRGPSRVELLRERGLADDGPTDGDGLGDLRWLPRGNLLRDSLRAYADDLAVEYGAMPVETPATRASVLRDARLAESDLPLRLYERSTRSGTSARPEIHTATESVERAEAELRAQVELARRTVEDLGLRYEVAIRPTREFYDDNEAWVRSLVADLDRPALLEIRPESRRHPPVEVAFAVIDRSGRPIETAAVELDLTSAERFDIEYGTGEADDSDDASAESRYPAVLHCSPFGSVERAVTALLEAAAEREVPRLPTWLSPVQVRFVPVADRHVEYCDASADDLESAGVRADVDDRDETVGDRIAEAEGDWVPYYAVVGDRETEDGSETRSDRGEGGEGEVDGAGDDGGEKLKVTVRGERTEREMTLTALREEVRAEVGDRPKKRRYFPKRVGRRPDLTGQ